MKAHPEVPDSDGAMLEGQEQLVLVQEDEGGWGHVLRLLHLHPLPVPHVQHLNNDDITVTVGETALCVVVGWTVDRDEHGLHPDVDLTLPCKACCMARGATITEHGFPGSVKTTGLAAQRTRTCRLRPSCLTRSFSLNCSMKSILPSLVSLCEKSCRMQRVRSKCRVSADHKHPILHCRHPRVRAVPPFS